MKPFALIRRTLIGLAGSILGVALMAFVAQAREVTANVEAGGLVIHDATETARNFCSTDAEGRTWFTLPGGQRFELVTSTADPAISNPGDGSFHAFEASIVREALSEVTFPIENVRAEIFVLPYPRRSGLESAAGPGLILLSPGVRGLTREHQHAEVVHELGHVVQYALMPDSDWNRWGDYRSLRGIDDETQFPPTGSHSVRPHEIFAEDFRALFGGARANYSGTIENPYLSHPSLVAGLRDFMLSLADGPATLSVALAAFPNPSRGAMTFTRTGASASVLDLFDAQGRKVTSVVPGVAGQRVTWTWDGLDVTGRRVQPGILFARTRDPQSRTVRVTILP